MPLRLSDLPKKGITLYEEYVAHIYHSLGLLNKVVFRQQVVCFTCGNFFASDGKHYPSHCIKCGLQFGREKYQHCMVDFLLKNEDKRGVLYINGIVHEKSRVKKKDQHQIEKLHELGYKTFILTNDEIEMTEAKILVGYLASLPQALSSQVLDQTINTNISFHKWRKTDVGLSWNMRPS